MTATPNTLPKDSGEWFSWVQARLRVLERHRHGGADEIATMQSDIFLSLDSGWTVTSPYARRVGNAIQVACYLQYNANISTSIVDGNITNIGVGYLLPLWYPMATTPFFTAGVGPMVGGYVDAAGRIGIGAMIPNTTWNANTNYWFSGTWLSADTTN